VPFLHGARDAVVRDQARTVLYQEPRKGLALSETKEYTAHRVRAGDVGVPANLETHTIRQRRMMVLHLDQLASYEEAVWDEWP
jgi:hypothetical protein